jgi:hypothetical protein
VSRNVQSVLKTSWKEESFLGWTDKCLFSRKEGKKEDVYCCSVTSKERCLVSGKEEFLICGPEDTRKEGCSLNILPSCLLGRTWLRQLAESVLQEGGMHRISYDG